MVRTAGIIIGCSLEWFIRCLIEDTHLCRLKAINVSMA
jgi:hypothetical protein